MATGSPWEIAWRRSRCGAGTEARAGSPPDRMRRAWRRRLPRPRTSSATRSVTARRRRAMRSRRWRNGSRRGRRNSSTKPSAATCGRCSASSTCPISSQVLGLLQDEPPARADLARDPPRNLLQRRGDGRVLQSRPGDGDLGERRDDRHGVLHDRPGARGEAGHRSGRPTPACSATALRPTRGFPGTSSARSSWTGRAIRCSPAGRSAPTTRARSPSDGAAGTSPAPAVGRSTWAT